MMMMMMAVQRNCDWLSLCKWHLQAGLIKPGLYNGDYYPSKYSKRYILMIVMVNSNIDH